MVLAFSSLGRQFLDKKIPRRARGKKFVYGEDNEYGSLIQVTFIPAFLLQLVSRPATVNQQRGARHELRDIGSQIHHGTHDVFHRAHPT